MKPTVSELLDIFEADDVWGVPSGKVRALLLHTALSLRTLLPDNDHALRALACLQTTLTHSMAALEEA